MAIISVATTIDKLSSGNEDLSQDLWLLYVAGDPVSSFESVVEQAHLQSEIDQLMISRLVTPPRQHTLDFLQRFSELERSVMVLLMIGLSIDKIAAYKSLSIIRLQSIIATIRQSKEWNSYGLKEMV